MQQFPSCPRTFSKSQPPYSPSVTGGNGAGKTFQGIYHKGIPCSFSLLKLTKEPFPSIAMIFERRHVPHLHEQSRKYLRILPFASLFVIMMKKLNGISPNRVGGTSGYWQGRIRAFLQRWNTPGFSTPGQLATAAQWAIDCGEATRMGESIVGPLFKRNRRHPHLLGINSKKPFVSWLKSFASEIC